MINMSYNYLAYQSFVFCWELGEMAPCDWVEGVSSLEVWEGWAQQQ